MCARAPWKSSRIRFTKRASWPDRYCLHLLSRSSIYIYICNYYHYYNVYRRKRFFFLPPSLVNQFSNTCILYLRDERLCIIIISIYYTTSTVVRFAFIITETFDSRKKNLPIWGVRFCSVVFHEYIIYQRMRSYNYVMRACLRARRAVLF